MSKDFPRKLKQLENAGAYAKKNIVLKRWGQLLREIPAARDVLQRGKDAGLLIDLRDIRDIRGGVVTRANPYFLVTELTFDKIPPRFHITRNDFERVTVVRDGLDTLNRMERKFLRPV